MPLKSRNESPIGEKEMELLKAAAKDGILQIVEVESMRRVFADGHEFGCEEDPLLAVQYLDALNTLCGRRLMIHQGDAIFRPTVHGFDLATRPQK